MSLAEALPRKMSSNTRYIALGVILCSILIGVKCETSPSDDAQPAEDLSEFEWEWEMMHFPNPRESPQFCRRQITSSVCDPDEIISKRQENQLDRLIESISNETICLCDDEEHTKGHGIQIGIALMKKFRMRNVTHPAVVAQEFAHHLRADWKLSHCNNDILILVATNLEQIYVSIGERANEFLSDNKIRDEAYFEGKKHFLNKQYYQGIESMLQLYYDLGRTISYEDWKTIHDRKLVQPTDMGFILGMSFLFLLFVAALLGCLVFFRNKFSHEATGYDMERMLKRSFWLGPSPGPRDADKDYSAHFKKNLAYGGSGVYQPCTIEDENAPKVVLGQYAKTSNAAKSIEEHFSLYDSDEEDFEAKYQRRSQHVATAQVQAGPNPELDTTHEELDTTIAKR